MSVGIECKLSYKCFCGYKSWKSDDKVSFIRLNSVHSSSLCIPHVQSENSNISQTEQKYIFHTEYILYSFTWLVRMTCNTTETITHNYEVTIICCPLTTPTALPWRTVVDLMLLATRNSSLPRTEFASKLFPFPVFPMINTSKE